MRTWILGSEAIVDWYFGRAGVAPYVRAIVEGHESGAISTVSEVVLWQAIQPAEEQKHEALLSLLRRVPLDRAIAQRAGQLRQQFGLDRLSVSDAVVAASAELTGRTLLTRNSRTFEPLEGTIPLQFYAKA